MPSFGVSAPGKSIEATLEVSTPKVEADVSLPSVQGDLKTSDLTIELPSADLEVQAGQVGVKLPQGQVPEGDVAAQASGAGLKGHLPKVQMPSFKMPKVDIKAPQVDVKGPKLDLKGPKGQVTTPDVDVSVSVPGAEVDVQAPGVKVEPVRLEGDLSLGDKDMAAKDSKFKMPKFKMPSFGVPATEEPLQPSALAVASPEEEAAAGGMAVDSQGRWFKMPTLRMPRFRRSSRDRGGAGKQEVAAAGAKELLGPASSVGDSASLRPPEAEAAVTASESKLSAGVLGQDPDSTGSQLVLPSAGRPEADLSPSEARVPPAEGSLPLVTAGRGLSESPGGTPIPTPGERDLARVEATTGKRSFQLEGPLKLKASSTDVPSQISVVNTNQLWEDSVLTVRFPKFKVPRFSFPAPSAEADVFIPTVKEVQCPEPGAGGALGGESPGPWEASILKAGAGGPGEQPAGLDLSLAAPPISKVRVHIQGAQAESQEVTIHSRVTPEVADLSKPRAFSTQIVRESEIPVSTIQTPAYGFSLLKVKIPEPQTQATAHTATREGLEEAATQASPGADPVAGELQPDTGEPFEIISPSASALGPQTLTLDVPSGHQLADSCLDEEPAEILEFPPDDGRDAATPLADGDRAPTERPESKKPGLLWSWLPNIGFSSSVEGTSADSKEGVPSPAPAETQPQARPDAELPRKQERAGWFRFPKLGFSSSPAKKGRSTEEEADPAEQKLHEETVTFFDARESFSPDEKDERELAAAAGTEPTLPEQDDTPGDASVPRPPPREGHEV
uniref:AHNAK nucleoprotein 2 n=1 Tax=Prolemur simus TaxID=1328070 RepID=A0A8C8ZB73_PROSS